MADRGHLELCPLTQNAGVFGRDVKAKYFIKGQINHQNILAEGWSRN